jgi:hypothetical protein
MALGIHFISWISARRDPLRSDGNASLDRLLLLRREDPAETANIEESLDLDLFDSESCC